MDQYSPNGAGPAPSRPLLEPMPYGECDLDREPLALLPTPTDLPLPRTESPAKVPFQGEIAQALGNRTPGESVLGAVLLTSLLLLLVIRRTLVRTRRSPTRPRNGGQFIRYSARRRSRARGWSVGFAAAFLALLSLIPTAFWLALDQAEERRRQHDHVAAHHLLLRLQDFFPIVAWVDRWQRDPVALMLEANAVEGIREGLAASRLDVATKLARWPGVVTQEGREARQAAQLASAAWGLEQGDAHWALLRAEDARSAGAGSKEAMEAAERARLHWMVQSLRKGDVQEAKRQGQRLRPAWRPDLQAALAATAARGQALQHFDKDRLIEAIEVLEAAWGEGHRWPEIRTWLACDLAGLWERSATTALGRGEPAAAVDALRSAQGYVADSPVVLKAFPHALREQGLRQVEEGRATEAIASLEEALSRTAAAERHLAPSLREDLKDAYLLLGRQSFETERFDEAVAAMERAHQYSGGDAETSRALASALLRRADYGLERGRFDGAREDLVAVRRHPDLASEAKLRLRWLPGSEGRVRAIGMVNQWVDLPDVRGEKPIDSDGDGRADFLVYFGPGGAVGSRDLAQPRAQVAFTQAGAEDRVYLLLRDVTGDGAFDEATTYEDDARSYALVDADGDRKPDYNLHYLEGQLIFREILSARVMLRLGGLAIGVRSDVFSRPDPYLVVRHQGKSILRTETHVNTQFAYFGEGVVIQFEHEDELDLLLFDEDVFNPNEFLDRLKLSGPLPESGHYWMQHRNASIELAIQPSDLPVGYRAAFDPPEPDYNTFRDNPLLAPEFGELVARAREKEAQGQAMEWVSSMAVSELLVVALLPEAPLLAQIALGIGVESVVGPALQ